MKVKANKRISTFEETSKECTVHLQHRSKTIDRMELMRTGDRTIVMEAAIKIEAVAVEVVAVMEVVTTTRVDGIMVLGKEGMVITEEGEAEGHEEATSPLMMWARAVADTICRGVSPITMITWLQVTIILLFRRLVVLELVACHMASDCIKSNEYGVAKVTRWTDMGATALKGNQATIKVGSWTDTWSDGVVPFASSFIDTQ